MHLLGITVEQDAAGDVRGTVDLTPHLLDAGGGPRLAVVAMLVDALGGLRSISAVVPEWAFTADLSIHLTDDGRAPDAPPPTELRADLHIRRRGRRTLVIEVDLVTDATHRVGSAILTFAVVPRPAHLADLDVSIEPGTRPMGSTDERLEVDWLTEIGATSPTAGTLVLETRREVQNTVGALHGAIHAALVDEAAASLGRDLLGGACATTDLQLAYLDLGMVGPLTATATAVGTPAVGDRAMAAVVELRDATGHLSSYSTVRVRRTGDAN